jgi:peptidyl-prolyl cis-trans isomerase B (cyclophilin B)
MRAWNVVFALIVAGCASGPGAEERSAETARIRTLAARKGIDVDGTSGVDEMRIVSAGPAFLVGASGRDDAADVIEKALAPDAPPDVVAAAAMGLGYSKSDATERVLVALALRPSHPPEAVESLFCYYRFRGADKPAPAKLPDAKLFDFERHPTVRGRAALAHLGRAVKDPALIPVLERLANDPEFEVRRAAALALAEGPPKSTRPEADRARCIAALERRVSGLLNDDAHVVAAGCRALASYDDPAVAPLLLPKLNHPDFNVRVAALEGLGTRKAKSAVAKMTELAKSDPSTSVRFAAAEQLAEIDAAAALALVDRLLADPSEYVRSAGVDVLAKSDDPAAVARLATIAKSDPHVRVRETAVGAFEGKKDSQTAKDAVRAALADKDVGVASTACTVIGKNQWTEFFKPLCEIALNFPGCAGADVREARLSALSELEMDWTTVEGFGPDDYRALFEVGRADENPSVRLAAEKALAKLDKKDPPTTYSRGADLSGDLVPGGAPIFDKDAFLVVVTDKGTMKIRLFPEQAPVHCAHVAALARNHFYDGLTWHRVVPDFVIQGGCPRGDGSGNAGVTLPLEPTMVPFERGTLGMPRSEHPDTGGCQLFICHSRAPHLDVRYTAFGKVVEGLDVIDKIDVDDKIVRVTVEGAR